ncbi:MAG: septum formation protein Maf [Bacteroidetes bacterium]|nr:septum formation protein Maf [Bacteroidota bacterium]
MFPENLSGKKIILTSRSPRRQFLLRECGLEFEIAENEIEEYFPPELKAEQIALYLCKKKAEALYDDLDEYSLLITADTIVWIEGRVLNKPNDEADALRMLKMLNGKKHEVFTGVYLMSLMDEKTFCVRSEVYFKNRTDEELLNYIRIKNPFDKAGAYGAQECLQPGMNPCSNEENDFLKKIGKTSLLEKCLPPAGENPFVLVDHIEGSYFNVMGLPVKELFEELQKF